MNTNEDSTASTDNKLLSRLRDISARTFGVRPERKEQLYIEILESASLNDASYWLQVIFSAGIATLGLVLNSVAVIIGAMLISPLMGPILASGLAFAAGDLILAVRAVANLALSCFVAISFAVLLVAVLPFKEMTAEIVARTQPTTLDLIVALFSGAVGSIAVCKEVKGVVTSIPGVAIAVALMPPLCVTGYGIGIALSISANEGMRVARGGGLLFLTNLIAITFTAMLVFLLFHIDTPQVKARVREWREKDMLSRKIDNGLRKLPDFEKLKIVGSLPARLLLISLLILLILVPLSKSFAKLKHEIARQQRDNKVRRAATDIWQQNFAQLPNGLPRCYIGNLEATERDGKVQLLLRVFTGKPYTKNERADYVRQLAARLNLSPSAIALQLIEIPTTDVALQTHKQDENIKSAIPAPTPTVAESQATLLQLVGTALDTLRLPDPAQLVDYDVTARSDTPTQVRVNYLSPREISSDARNLLAENIRTQLADPNVQTAFTWIESEKTLPAFKQNQSTITDNIGAALAPMAALLTQHPNWRIEITSGAARTESSGIADARLQAITKHLTEGLHIPSTQIQQITNNDTGRTSLLKLIIPANLDQVQDK